MFEANKDLKSPIDEVRPEAAPGWEGPPVEALELHLDDRTMVTVNKRPGLDMFLERLSQRKGEDGYRVVTFTAAAMVRGHPSSSEADDSALTELGLGSVLGLGLRVRVRAAVDSAPTELRKRSVRRD